MAERKVLNKYIPPSYNPNVQLRSGGSRRAKVRLMAPFSMQCNTCGEYIYKGKKFNAKKEKALGEDYLGIIIYRFKIACPCCAAEITFKTDPKNTDYVAERGALRNFEPWRDETRSHQEVKADKLKEEEDNPMKALENRTIESKREMDILDALDEIRTKNAKIDRADVDEALNRIHEKETPEEIEEKDFDKEDEELARQVFHDLDGEKVRRLVDEPFKEFKKPEPVVKEKKPADLGIKKKQVSESILGIKRKAPSEKPVKSLVMDYGSDSD
ncbi:hypothetical protein HDV04_003890 [Boothiomyces sp. JEL0838]|nr:hypothetical protein HDV04_003890 [Boothiomyces sp. JEL0838]